MDKKEKAMLKEFEVNKWNGKKIIVYGAGSEGALIADKLIRQNLNNFIFCDSYKAGGFLAGKEILDRSIMKTGMDFNVIIGSTQYCVEIYNSLKELGVEDRVIFTAQNILTSSIHKEKTHFMDDIYRYHRYEAMYAEFNAYVSDGWYLNHLDIVITEICTLNCEACGSLMPLYKKPHNCDSERIFEAFDNLLKSNCFIGSVNLIGGEPFVNQPLIEEILWRYKDEKKIGLFQIISNGTILPNNNTLEAMQSIDRLYVIFSNYGCLSRKQEEAVKILDEYGIDVAVEQEADINAESNTLWIDYGKVHHYDFPKEKHQKMFDTCIDGKTCRTLLNGKLYICPRIAHGINLGLIPEDIPRGSLNLLNSALQGMDWREIKRKCIAFLENKEYPPACEYCNHDAGILVERAKQVEK